MSLSCVTTSHLLDVQIILPFFNGPIGPNVSVGGLCLVK